MFETVEEFNNLGTTLTNQNSIHEEIKNRLKAGNACYLSMQNFAVHKCKDYYRQKYNLVSCFMWV
jgi:hypothetical protein